MVENNLREGNFRSSCLNNISENNLLKLIETFNFICDGKSYFLQKVNECMDFYYTQTECSALNNEESQEALDCLINEIMFLYKNENRMDQNEKDGLLFQLCVFFLSMDENIRMFSIMNDMVSGVAKFGLLMLYAIKLSNSCGKVYGEIYFEKARKMVEANEEVKNMLIRAKNI
ncbi:MAG: hypothetical protein WC002_09930 [Candidatus Muiribacteriota bacterium]